MSNKESLTYYVSREGRIMGRLGGFIITTSECPTIVGTNV